MEIDQFQRIQGLEAFCKAADLLPWPVCILDAGLHPLFTNARFHKMLPEFGSGTLADCLPHSEQELFRRFVEHQFENGQETHTGTALRCHLCRSGEWIPVEVEACLVQQELTPVMALFLKDLSVHRRRQQRRAEQKRQFRSILDNTGAVVYIKDPQGRYRFVNSLYESLFHVSNEQIRGKTDFEIFNDHVAAQFRKVDQQVLESGEMVRIQEVATHDDGPHTYISVKFPLRNSRGRITGLAGISTDITDQFQAQQEIVAAQAVQRLLYPRTDPKFSGYDMAGTVSPANVVSGDYYDFIWLSPTRLVVAIGDVSGHGLGPALEMVETRSYLRAILRTEVRLDVTMECLNEFLYRDLRDSAFVTLFLADLDFSDHSFRYVGAGHRADLLRADGSIEMLKSTGLMLGVDAKVSYECSGPYSLNPGDLLLLSTDGITEAMDPVGEFFGHQRMLKEVRERVHFTARHVVEHLIQSARCTSKSHAQADDMTAVVVKRIS